MSLQSTPFTAVPSETARVARAVFPRGNLYMRLRDELGRCMKMKPLPRYSKMNMDIRDATQSPGQAEVRRGEMAMRAGA
jgi:hypothetical protein